MFELTEVSDVLDQLLIQRLNVILALIALLPLSRTNTKTNYRLSLLIYLAGADLEHAEQLLQLDVTRQMERCLSEAKASFLHCQALLLPRHMTARVGQDVVRSSNDEPCGLRGASIKVYVQRKDGLKSVGSIFPDPSVTPTFELSVIFKADEEDGWPPLRHIFDSSKVLKLRAEYRLVKRKLYSSASPVIHDFN